MAKKENRHFPSHPVKSGSKTVVVAPSKHQSGYKRTLPRKAK